MKTAVTKSALGAVALAGVVVFAAGQPAFAQTYTVTGMTATTITMDIADPDDTGEQGMVRWYATTTNTCVTPTPASQLDGSGSSVTVPSQYNGGPLTTNNLPQTGFQVTGLSGGMAYCFLIVLGDDTYWHSTTTPVQTAATAPGQPAAVTFGEVTANSIVVNWAAPSSTGGAPITEYTLTRTPAFAAAVTVTGTTYTDMNLDPETQYSYQVAATNSVSTGAASPAAMITTAAAPAATVTPSSGEQVNAAVLPEVLRGTTRGIHNSIFNRIQQRQQQDGRWK